MYTMKATKVFKKDIKKLNKDEYSEVQYVINLLKLGKKLPEKYRDHKLKGDKTGKRDCHIRPDLALVYEVNKEIYLIKLLRVGNHANLQLSSFKYSDKELKEKYQQCLDVLNKLPIEDIGNSDDWEYDDELRHYIDNGSLVHIKNNNLNENNTTTIGKRIVNEDDFSYLLKDKNNINEKVDFSQDVDDNDEFERKFGSIDKDRTMSLDEFNSWMGSIIDDIKDKENKRLKEELTKEQEEYFKNSKIRDEKGNLLVCYHGTTNPGFKEFNASKGKSQFGAYKFKNYNVNYFTTSKQTAKGYTKLGNGDVYACYLNVVNPYIVNNETEGDIKSWRNIKDKNVRNKQIQTFDRLLNKWFNKYPEVEDLDEINKDFYPFGYEFRLQDEDSELVDVYKLPDNSYFGNEEKVLSSYYLFELFDRNDSILKDTIIGEEEDDYYLNNDDIVKWVLYMNENEGTNYDGIIIPDILDVGPSGSPFSENTTDIITLKSSNQIKLIDNKNPTSSSRIDENELLERDDDKNKAPKIINCVNYYQSLITAISNSFGENSKGIIDNAIKPTIKRHPRVIAHLDFAKDLERYIVSGSLGNPKLLSSILSKLGSIVKNLDNNEVRLSKRSSTSSTRLKNDNITFNKFSFSTPLMELQLGNHTNNFRILYCSIGRLIILLSFYYKRDRETDSSIIEVSKNRCKEIVVLTNDK